MCLGGRGPGSVRSSVEHSADCVPLAQQKHMTERTLPVLCLALKSARSLAKLPFTVLLKQFGLAARLLLGSEEKSSCPLVSVEGHERKGEGHHHFLLHLTLGCPEVYNL